MSYSPSIQRVESHPHDDATHDDATVGQLVHRLTEQVPQLVRSEVRLAQLELSAKGKQAGVGAGLFGAAGILGFLGLAGLVATAILALALVLPAWASALIVSVAVLLIAGIAALIGRTRVRAATPAKPELAMEGVRRDLAAMKGDRS